MPDPDDDAQVTSWAPFGSYTADDDLPPLPDEPPPLADAAPPTGTPNAVPDVDAPRAEAPPEVPSWEDFLPHRPAVEEDEPWERPAEPAEDEPWRPPPGPVEEDEPWRPPAEPTGEAPPPAAPAAAAESTAFFNWTTPPAARTPQAEAPADTGYVPGRDDAPAPQRSGKKGASGGFALFLAAVAWLWIGPVAAVIAIFVGVAALKKPRTPRDRSLAGVAIALAVLNLLGLLAGLSLVGGV